MAPMLQQKSRMMVTSDTSVSSAFLLLVDGRIPTGSYAHSGGIEAAVADGRVGDLASLARYLEGRLATTGLCDASMAVAACSQLSDLETLAAEAAARCPSPALRLASRAEGRGLIRAARSMWPNEELDALATRDGARGLLWSVALGVVARVAGLDDFHAAIAAAHAAVAGPAWAAVRLTGLDPYGVAGVLASLAPVVDETAERALLASAIRPLRLLPAPAAPLQEIAAERREGWEVRLFVS